MDYEHQLELKVRDYECDLQGIVNNSVYQNYIEHARHEYLDSLGLNFAELFKQGITAVVARINISYKVPLKSSDIFVVKTSTEVKGVKIIFNQDIYRKSDNKLCVRAEVTTATLVNDKLAHCPLIADALSKE